jgi:hypothetical protein
MQVACRRVRNGRIGPPKEEWQAGSPYSFTSRPREAVRGFPRDSLTAKNCKAMQNRQVESLILRDASDQM